MNFRDSAYDFDYAEISQAIEAKGQQGRKILLEGITLDQLCEWILDLNVYLIPGN